MGTTCIWHFKRNPFEKTRRQLQTQNQYHACKSDSASYQLVNFPIKKGLCCWEVRILLGKSTWRRNSLTGISNFASSFWRFNAVHSEDLFGSIRKGHTTKNPFKWKGGWLKTGVESDAFFTFFQPCQVASNLSNLSRKKKDLPKKNMLKKLADFFLFCWSVEFLPAALQFHDLHYTILTVLTSSIQRVGKWNSRIFTASDDVKYFRPGTFKFFGAWGGSNKTTHFEVYFIMELQTSHVMKLSPRTPRWSVKARRWLRLKGCLSMFFCQITSQNRIDSDRCPFRRNELAKLFSRFRSSFKIYFSG